MELIGRDEEQIKLHSYATSNSSEFVAVYGRRRVGKTFLIRETFKNKFDFSFTGLANVNTTQQLLAFNYALQEYGSENEKIATTWIEAFQQLKELLTNRKSKKKIVFIDEMPWMDSPRSNFISALEHFWNGWASVQKDILLITCGSATSWMINKLINNKGGLHNRITQKIPLSPFTLKECEEFLKYKRINYTQYQIIEIYMVMGGIPYYLNALQKELSAAQNIDQICFAQNGILKTEFENLYSSLFKNSQHHISIIEALSKKVKGLNRAEIIAATKLPNGGTTTNMLSELEQCGFIKKYTPFHKKNRESLYQLVDFYSLFYFQFMHKTKNTETGFWINMYDTPKHRAWSGYAFEQVCMAHITQIKKALGISGVQTNISSWRSKEKKNGAQIDLLIDRNDQTINIVEIKFSINEFTINSKYDSNLRNKIGKFKNETTTKKAVSLVMLTTFGVKINKYSLSLLQNNLTSNCLFVV